LIFKGWACAAIGFKLIPNPLAAITAPDIFKKPLLLTSIDYSLLSSLEIDTPFMGYPFQTREARPFPAAPIVHLSWRSSLEKVNRRA
jgi:hypothetical protein